MWGMIKQSVTLNSHAEMNQQKTSSIIISTYCNCGPRLSLHRSGLKASLRTLSKISGTVHYSRIHSGDGSLPYSTAARSSSPKKSSKKSQSNSFQEVSQPDAQKELDLLLQVTSLSPQSRRGWCPPYLRTSVLLAFVTAYLMLAVLLVGLYDYAQNHQGLTKYGQRWHYLFRYGPTAGRSHLVYNEKAVMLLSQRLSFDSFRRDLGPSRVWYKTISAVVYHVKGVKVCGAERAARLSFPVECASSSASHIVPTLYRRSQHLWVATP